MPNVIGIRFKNTGKVYYFDPGAMDPEVGSFAIVETMRGVEIGEVAAARRAISESELAAPLKPIIRLATDDDLRKVQDNKDKQERAFEVCVQKISAHNLQMKLVDVEYTFDGSKIIFYFTANGRVDFRELVKDLASVFHMRIELRQIGVRDEAKMLGGLGPCGRPICCGGFLGDFQPVSIKMAKEQGLSLNPTKISGLCGRLMCCLKYEQHHYESAHKRMPRVGREVITPDGHGIVIDTNVLKETVRVRVQTADHGLDLRNYAVDTVKVVGRQNNAETDDDLYTAPGSEDYVDYDGSLLEVVDEPGDIQTIGQRKPPHRQRPGNKRPSPYKPRKQNHDRPAPATRESDKT